MKRSYENTRKVSLCVALICGLISIVFSAFSLLSGDYWFLSLIALLSSIAFGVDLLITARYLMVSAKKFSAIHFWLITFIFSMVASAVAYHSGAQMVMLIADLIACSLVMINAFCSYWLYIKKEDLSAWFLLSLVPITALIALRLFFENWFIVLLAFVGLLESVSIFFKHKGNTYLKALLITEGILWCAFCVIAFFLDKYDVLIPLCRNLGYLKLFFFSAYVIETPHNELPVMIPKSEADFWAEKFSRMVVKKSRGLTETEILDQPISVLRSLTDDEAHLLKDIFGIVTVRDLAENPYFNMAAEIIDETKKNKKKG